MFGQGSRTFEVSRLGKTDITVISEVLDMLIEHSDIRNIKEDSNCIFLSTSGRKTLWRRQIGDLSIFTTRESDAMMRDFVESIGWDGENLRQLKRHPVFWSISERLEFVQALVKQDSPLRRELGCRADRVFTGSWREKFRRFDNRYADFVRCEESRNWMPAPTDSMDSLLDYIGKKLKHVNTSVRAARIEGPYGDLQLNLFEFLMRPIPELLLEASKLSGD
jgi:hypothetical protein